MVASRLSYVQYCYYCTTDIQFYSILLFFFIFAALIFVLSTLFHVQANFPDTGLSYLMSGVYMLTV